MGPKHEGHLMKYQVCLLDLDGTVYLGDSLIPGVDAVIRQLHERDVRVIFLTNSALESRHSLVGKLRRLGIYTKVEDVINTTFVTVKYLSTQKPGSTIHVIGETPLIQELKTAGFKIVDHLSDRPEGTDFVLISIDRSLTYAKLHFAYLAARAGATIVATNSDIICPVENGVILDAGMTIAAVETVLERELDVLIGKPSSIMVEVVLDYIHVSPDKCILVGDRLETDIAMGKKAGLDTALVMTGAADRADLEESEVKPDYVINRLEEILSFK
jgi:NagD protein